MALNTYAALQTAIASWLNRDDLTSHIPDFITLLEAKLRIDESVRQRVLTALSVASGTVTLPTDVKIALELYHDGPVHFGPLDIVAPNQLAAYKARFGTTGVPRAAALLTEIGQMLVAPAPTETIQLRFVYDASVTPLVSAAGGTNWVLASHPNVYLFGSLAEAEPFLENDERIGLWTGKYNEALAQLKCLRLLQDFGSNTLQRQTSRRMG